MTPRESAGPGPATIAPGLVELLSSDDVVAIAPALLGARLAVASPEGTVAVRLTEVEAYAGEIDPGSHAFRGRTARNSSMFEAAGRVYVYFTYGMHHCVNVVCGAEGVSRAVLLRAGEVVEGVDVARGRRPAARKDRDLARGPARLTSALGLTREDDGELLGGAGSRICLELAGSADAVPAELVRSGPRVGVAGPGGDGEAFPWRFWIDGDPTVSPYKPAARRK